MSIELLFFDALPQFQVDVFAFIQYLKSSSRLFFLEKMISTCHCNSDEMLHRNVRTFSALLKGFQNSQRVFRNDSGAIAIFCHIVYCVTVSLFLASLYWSGHRWYWRSILWPWTCFLYIFLLVPPLCGTSGDRCRTVSWRTSPFINVRMWYLFFHLSEPNVFPQCLHPSNILELSQRFNLPA